MKSVRSARSPRWPVLAALAGGGWLGLAALAERMYATDPMSSGFDLELILQAGRKVAAGIGPYDPGMLAGIAPTAPTLFYSYPPQVAQLMSLVATVPGRLVFWGLWITALAGLLIVARLLTDRLRPDLDRRTVLLGTVAVAPACLALATGLLFGNVNALFPLAYGLVLLAAVGAERTDRFLGGLSLALAAATKLHPGSMGLWFLVRGARERRDGDRPRSWMTAAVAIAGLLVVLGLSIAVSGLDPWSDYVTVVKTGASSSLVDPRNGAPAAQLAAFVGGGDSLARQLQMFVGLIALAITAVAAWWVRDPVESVAWAAAASLVTLPVTWYHYPAAFIPFGLAALLRAARTVQWRATASLVATAIVIVDLAIAWLPLQWLGIVLVIMALRRSAPRPQADPVGVGVAS